MKNSNLSLLHEVRPNRTQEKNPPLLLMLHGYGSHENDLFGFANDLPDEFFIISVRAPHSLGFGGFAWYEIDFNQLGGGKMSNVPQALESRELLRSFITEAREAYNLANSDLWLMGFSQGCILSYGLALCYPKEVQKVLALSGYVLKDIVPNKYQPAAIQHLDFLVTHGTEDPVLPVQWARQTVQMLEQLKISHIYREYPIGHGINPECFNDIKKWMNERLQKA